MLSRVTPLLPSPWEHSSMTLKFSFVLSVRWFDRYFVIKSASITKLQFSMSEEMLFLVDRERGCENVALRINLHRSS